MDEIQQREKLEFIIDSCSSGKKVLAGVEHLIRHITSNEQPNVFDGYRIVMPIQLGTETKRYLFPDFLTTRLQSKAVGHLERFYQRHNAHTKIVETSVSLSFKWFYGVHAAQQLAQHPEWKREICKHARTLLHEFAPASPVAITTEALDVFCQQMQQSYAAHAENFGNMRRQIVRHGYKTERRDYETERHVRAAEQTQMLRMGENFFTEQPLINRLLLQSMYAYAPLNGAVSEKPEFSSFRKDKGERAIESYLFDRRAATNPNRVTIIISEDQGARKNIQRLRSQSNNTIFVISSYGLALALKTLGYIDDLTEVIDKQSLAVIEARQTKHNARIGRGKHTMNDVLVPEIEEKWAARLVEVMNTGRWQTPNISPTSFKPSAAKRLAGRG